LGEELIMQTKSHDFKLLNHYTVLIYPFFHNVTAGNRRRQIQLLEENWNLWWSRLDGEIGRALDDTYFFLPYIREVVFPETIIFKDKPPGKQYANWIRHIDQWNRKGLGYFCEELSHEAVLRITYKKALLQSIKSIEITNPVKSGELTESSKLSAQVQWIDAMLFPSGLGFIMLKVVLQEDSPQLGQLIDLNYYLRIVHPPNINWTLPELSFTQTANTMTVRDLMDFLTQGMVDNDANIYDLTQFMAHLSTSTHRRFSESEAGQVYGERCHVFSYACLNLMDDNSSSASKGVFKSVKDRLVFEFASSISVGDSVNNPMWIPSSEYAKGLKTQKQFSVWQAWCGMALKESVVFLGTKDINFNRKVLPSNIENDYLPLYLYSLYQKYQLFIFADELMRKGAYVARHLQEVRALMDRFMDFRNKYWFNEVTRKPLGGELYCKFQQGLESTTLYDLVSLQVKDLKEHYEERRQRRIDLLLNLVTFVFLPLGAVIGIFGMTFFTGSWTSFTIVIVTIFVISLGIWRWWTEEFGSRVK
jgi:hypothetical protein